MLSQLYASLMQLGRNAEAAEACAKAIGLCTDAPSPGWLEQLVLRLRANMI